MYQLCPLEYVEMVENFIIHLIALQLLASFCLFALVQMTERIEPAERSSILFQISLHF